jgi:hypothetical protein
MSKVRVDYKDVFIKTFVVNEEIPEKYTFNFHSKWVANDSPTKRIAIRKIEVFPMTFTAIARFGIDSGALDQYGVPIRKYEVILFTLTGKKSITEFIDYLVRSMNNLLQQYYHANGYAVTYTYIGSFFLEKSFY